MVLDTMSYSLMTVVAVLSFIVVVLAWFTESRKGSSDK